MNLPHLISTLWVHIIYVFKCGVFETNGKKSMQEEKNVYLCKYVMIYWYIILI